MRTQAVLFDLFETLVTELNVPVRRASSLAVELGVDQQAYKREWRSVRPDVVKGRCTFREALAGITLKLGQPADQSVLDRLCAERITQKHSVLRDVTTEVLAAVAELRGNGVRLGVISNAFAEDVAGWTESPLYPSFEVTLFSCHTGLVKPEPEVYRRACLALRLQPEQVLFVGDGADHELEGACASGLVAFRALWFVSKWPATPIGPNEPGLRQINQVLQYAVNTAA